MARGFGRHAELMEKRVRVRGEEMTVAQVIEEFAAANPFVRVGAQDLPGCGQVQIGDRQVFIYADYAD